MGRQLIRLHIHSLLGKIHVVPDHIFRLVQGFVDHLIRRPFEAGEVIAVHDEDDRFLPRSERIDKRTDKIIHLMNLLTVILKIRILPVSLHRYGINKVRTFSGIQGFNDLLNQNLVPAPSGRIPLNIVHVLNRRKRIEPDLGKHIVPVIKRRLIVMDGVSRIAEIL